MCSYAYGPPPPRSATAVPGRRVPASGRTPRPVRPPESRCRPRAGAGNGRPAPCRSRGTRSRSSARTTRRRPVRTGPRRAPWHHPHTQRPVAQVYAPARRDLTTNRSERASARGDLAVLIGFLVLALRSLRHARHDTGQAGEHLTELGSDRVLLPGQLGHLAAG